MTHPEAERVGTRVEPVGPRLPRAHRRAIPLVTAAPAVATTRRRARGGHRRRRGAIVAVGTVGPAAAETGARVALEHLHEQLLQLLERLVAALLHIERPTKRPTASESNG